MHLNTFAWWIFPVKKTVIFIEHTYAGIGKNQIISYEPDTDPMHTEVMQKKKGKEER